MPRTMGAEFMMINNLLLQNSLITKNAVDTRHCDQTLQLH